LHAVLLRIEQHRNAGQFPKARVNSMLTAMCSARARVGYMALSVPSFLKAQNLLER